MEVDNNHTSIYINQEHINRNFKEELRQPYRSQKILEHMKSKFNWDNKIINSIWWKVHGNTLRKMDRQDRHRISKWLFQWLPTHAFQHKIHLVSSPKCPACTTTTETNDHLLTRTVPQYCNIKQEWIGKLSTMLRDNHTPPLDHDIIVESIHAHTHKQPIPLIQQYDSNMHRNVKAAFLQQQRVGWDQFLLGRIAIGWNTFIEHHLLYHNISEDSITSELWATKLISTNWNAMLSLWEARNEIVHGATDEEKTKKYKHKLLQEIREIQEQNPNIRASDRDLVHKLITELKQCSTSSLIAWIRTARIIVKVNKSENSIATENTITRFLRTTPNASGTSTNHENDMEAIGHSTSMSTLTNGSQASSPQTKSNINPNSEVTGGILSMTQNSTDDTALQLTHAAGLGNQINQTKHAESVRNPSRKRSSRKSRRDSSVVRQENYLTTNTTPNTMTSGKQCPRPKLSAINLPTSTRTATEPNA